MSIVKYKNQSGVTYAYESIAIWDPEKKQSRPKRVYLGRIDEKTGEIISSSGKRGRPPKEKKELINEDDGKDYRALYAEVSKRNEVLSLQLAEEIRKNSVLTTENRKLMKALKDIGETVNGIWENKEE